LIKVAFRSEGWEVKKRKRERRTLKKVVGGERGAKKRGEVRFKIFLGKGREKVFYTSAPSRRVKTI